MKKLRILLSTLAIVLALGASFAFSSAEKLISPAYIDTTVSPNVCTEVDVECVGTQTACRKTIPDHGSKLIFDWDTTADCGPALKMNN